MDMVVEVATLLMEITPTLLMELLTVQIVLAELEVDAEVILGVVDVGVVADAEVVVDKISLTNTIIHKLTEQFAKVSALRYFYRNLKSPAYG